MMFNAWGMGSGWWVLGYLIYLAFIIGLVLLLIWITRQDVKDKGLLIAAVALIIGSIILGSLSMGFVHPGFNTSSNQNRWNFMRNMMDWDNSNTK